MWLCLAFITIISILRGSTGQLVTQTSGILTVAEGKHLSLSCSYEIKSSSIANTYWYIQHPGQPPKLLLSEFANYSPWFHAAKKGGKNGTFHLEKDAIQLEDSAVYFCAVRVVGSYKFIFGSGTRLVVMPNLEDSEPSVYQLEPKAESKESSDIAACLITDYSPGPINVKYNSSLEPVAINDSAVVVKEDGNKQSASLGVVIWSKNKDQFQCSATYEERTYQAEKEGDATCKETSSDTPAFETDERLNLLSLTVLGLRLIFFKGVALNLILTFWAWSR